MVSATASNSFTKSSAGSVTPMCWLTRNSTPELGKIVGRMQNLERGAPLVPIDQSVPVGNDVVHRAAGLAERYAAIHAARALPSRLVVLERENEFAIPAHALLDGERDFRDSLQFHEAGDFAHVSREGP